MAEQQNLQEAKVIARIFGVTVDEVDSLRKKKIITGHGNPPRYDLLPAIQDYFRYLHDKERYIGAAEVADLFGVTTRRIEQLKAEGTIRGTGKPTRYDRDETTKAYIAHLSDKAHGREQKQSVADLEEAKLKAEVEVKQAKAEAAKLELKELQGKMHRAEDVKAITTDHVLYMRSMLMALPGKLAVDCAACKTPSEAAARITEEVHRVLSNLADYEYDPEAYAQRVRDRRGWTEKHNDDERDNE